MCTLQDNTIVINTDSIQPAAAGISLYKTRKIAYENFRNRNQPEIEIVVIAYNRLEKTKHCVQSILRYTQDLNYRLLLIDNASSDGTYDYFQSVEHADKIIWRITKNIGLNYPLTLALQQFQTKYFVFVPNDIYVTKNWLSNLLRCYESDEKIGFVSPVSSNISNLQEVNLHFQDFEDMQRKAAVFNQYNPQKWEERLRLMPTLTIFSREICDVSGTVDLGFFHDFADDDISARIRHAGYKLILCGDTYVHHDHDFRNLEDKDPVQFQKSIETGRQNYRDKYFGIDGWDDINNFELGMMQLLGRQKNFPRKPTILGIDVRCGTPILQVRNLLRSKGILESSSQAFTTKANYFYDLQRVTEGHTVCDRIDFISEHYQPESCDLIVMGEPVNTYAEPVRVTENLLRFVRKGGRVMLKLRNASSIQAMLYMLGCRASIDGDMPVQLSLEAFSDCLKLMNVKHMDVLREVYDIPQEITEHLLCAIRASGLCKNPEEAWEQLQVRDYIFLIEK